MKAGSVLLALSVMWSISNVEAGWKLTFEDEFAGVEINTTTWKAADNYTHGSSELELYTKDEVFLDGQGHLVLRTRYRPNTTASYGRPNYHFTSGWIDSKEGFSQKFGRFEWRVKLPVALPTMWPALWMMPDPMQTVPKHLCWPAGGEIDVMETWGGKNGNQTAATVHFTPEGGASPTECGGQHDAVKGHIGVYPDVHHGAAPIDFSAEYHIFAVEWNATAISFFTDSIHTGTASSRDILVPRTPFYMIMNAAICGAKYCDSGTLPHETYHMLVDYVRAYQWTEDMVVV